MTIPRLAPISSVALISASARARNNGDGLAAWLISRFDALAASRNSPHTLALASSLASLPLPYGPVEDPTISQAITPAAAAPSPGPATSAATPPLNSNSTPPARAYADPAVRAWSAAISATPAVVILTPQYNWGYPGQLKNLLDHLYHEWRGKPVVLVTYGGHGGGQCAEQLRAVLERGLHMQVVGEVGITLPMEYIRGAERVGGAGEEPKWLAEWEGAVEVAFAKLVGELEE